MSVHWGGPGAGHVSRWSVATTGVPVLSLDFLTSNTLDPRVTFSRTTNATLVDSTGRVTYAPNNLLLYSEQFDNGVWSKVGVVTANATTAPDGTTTADSAATDGSNAQVAQGVVIASGATMVGSVYLKPNGLNAVEIVLLAANNTTPYARATFNVATGVISVAVATANGGTNASAAIAPAGNGWYRCSVTVTYPATTSAGMRINAAGATGAFYGWGAQFEAVTYQTLPSTYVQTVASAYYAPRFDYNPVTLAPNGLLIEEQRVNLLTYSDQFNNAAWSKSDATVTANNSVAPDGTITADTLADTVANTSHNINQTYASFTSGTTYTFTIFAKAGTATVVQILGSMAAFGANVWANFNLSTGVVGSVGTLTTASITPFGNGWYRCTITGAATATSSGSVSVNLTNSSATAVRGVVYVGSGQTTFIWGAQLEAGAFATSYIPTVASTVTRAADIASMTGTNFSSWYNQSEGTLFSTFQRAGSSNSGAVLGSNDNTTNNRIQIRATNATTVDNFIILSGSSNFFQSFTVLTNAITKAALGYKTNDPNSAVNGVAGATDTSEVIPIGLTTLGIGNVTSSGFLNGHLRTITYYSSRLTNAQLQALTA
jgi:hypothetical protein